MTALREALRLDPSLVEARASLGFALYGMGDLDGAIEELRGMLRRRPIEAIDGASGSDPGRQTRQVRIW